MGGDGPSGRDAAAVLRGFKAYLVAECGLADNTVSAYVRDVNRFVNFYGDFRKAALGDVVAYVRELSSTGAAATSLSRRLSSLRVFYRYLRDEGEVSASPLEFVESPKTPSRLPDYLHVNEVEAIIGAAAAVYEAAEMAHRPQREISDGARDLAMLALAYGCGLRASELVGLKRVDVDLKLALIRVRGKGGKERLVPFGEVARTFVQNYLRVSAGAGNGDNPYLFPSPRRRGRPVSRQLLWKTVKKYAALAGVEGVKPHLFRHTFATHLIQAGADVRTVQELLGHANITTTQIYAHLDTKSLKEFHEKFHPRK